MIEAMRSWLLEIITLSILCAAADSLMPAGGVKQVGKLLFGILLICAVLQPLADWRLAGAERWLLEYGEQMSLEEMNLERQVSDYQKSVIQEQCATYISDKAAELGIDCQVEVACEQSAEGLWMPVTTRLWGDFTEEERSQMERLLDRELGIPVQEQHYRQIKEESP